jgi:diguanylate cyclase (GGDEF)-like protein/PAS domain S-box-containing protein
MEHSDETGAVVDERLVRNGLTRLLGSYGSGRTSVLIGAYLLVAAGCAVRVLSSAPSVELGLAAIFAVMLVSAEFGTRAGLYCSATALAGMTAVALPGWTGEGLVTIAGRAVVLVFLARVVGRSAERAERSRRLLEQVLEATTDAIYVKDVEGRYLLVNSATAQLVGRSGREIVGRDNTEVLPDLAGEIAGRDDGVLGSDASAAYEIHGRFGDATRVLSVTKSPFRDATGAVIGSLGIARDITEQRRLQAESTRFFDLSVDMLCAVGFDGRMRLFNGAWERCLGWNPDELLGASILDFIAPEDHAGLSAATRAARVAGARVVNRWRAKDGSWHWIDWSLRTVDGEQLVYASGRDVTQERMAMSALASSERQFGEAQERFRHAFENAPIGMAVADLDGRYLEVNQALCTLTGYTAKELLDETFASITHPDDLAADLLTMAALIDGTIGSSVDEKRYLRPDGSLVWALRSVTLVHDADGEPLHFLDQIQDVTERRRFEHELRRLADHDPLTGLYNRRRFEQELDRHVAEVARYGPRGALLVLDLDHFKYVNDALGHHAGDELILSVAAVLQDRLRETDTMARLGGDEFAVLLPHADAGAAEHVAAQLVRAVREEAAVAAGDRSRRVTTSIGIAPFHRGDLSGEEILIEADLAMYEAKEAGRDRYAVVARDADRPKRMLGRMSWLERIRAAIDADRFALYAQPIRDLRSGEIAQHELLLRMIGDDGDLISPGAFLPLAERFGLAPEIDRWVAGHAIDLLAADPGGHVALEINLSGLSLSDSGLLHLIESAVQSGRVDPRRLIFEITETAAVSNIPLARRFAERLTQLGCRFALDDFGAGFGSFYYLKHLPFDYLKIDGEFVAGCLGNRTDQLVIEAVVRIARGLGKETVAEFVGDAQLEEFVRSQGVDHAQGFHVGRPVPVADIGLGAGAPRILKADRSGST